MAVLPHVAHVSLKRENVGKPWTEEEVNKLLDGVSRGYSFETIAENHGRMIGGISSRLREIAADYYYNNELPVEKIQKFTGLSKDEVILSITHRGAKMEERANKVPKVPKGQPLITFPNTVPKAENNDLKEVLEILKDIQSTLKDFVKGNYIKVKRVSLNSHT